MSGTTTGSAAEPGGPGERRADAGSPPAAAADPDASTVDEPQVPEPVPAVAAGVFGERFDRAVRYAELLCDDGVIRGLIGPREVARIWSRHLLNCVAVAPLLADGAIVCDLGSGAGLPGIPLALARPDLRVTLLEPLLRRATFLGEVLETLALENASVERGRAEERRGVIDVDVVVVRAVAPMEKLIGWAMPLLRPGGELLALKGESASEELARVRPRLKRAGAEESHVEVLDLPGMPAAATVIRVRKAARAAAGRRRAR